MMFVVLLTNKSKEPFLDLIPELKNKFPKEIFSIYGNEEDTYQLRIEGSGDEREPRAFAIKYIKSWKPKSK